MQASGKSTNSKCALALLQGLHERTGQDCALHEATKSSLWDSNVMSLILPFNFYKFLILASAGSDRLEDVQTGLVEEFQKTGTAAQITVVNASEYTPTFKELLGYDAVFTFAFFDYKDHMKIGDVLAQYTESGRGGVLIANYSMCAHKKEQQVSGRFMKRNLHPLTMGDFQDSRTNHVNNLQWDDSLW